MADKDLSEAIQQAVEREVARVLHQSAAVQIEAAERGIKLAAPTTEAAAARYVIYWTAKMA